jgi:hypothetical protein
MRSLFIAIALTATGLGAAHADVRRPASGNPIVVPQSAPEQEPNAVELSAHFECLGNRHLMTLVLQHQQDWNVCL